MNSATPLRLAFLLNVALAISSPPTVSAGPLKREDSRSREAASPVQNIHDWIRREIEEYRTFPRLDLAMRLARSGQVDKAKGQLDRLLAENPDDLRVAFSDVILLYELHDYDQVVKRTTSILARHISFTPALMYRGFARQALGRRREALDDFTALQSRADLDTPGRILCLEALVDLALAEKDYHLVLSASDSLKSVNPSAHLLYARALALQALGRTAESSNVLRLALDCASDPRERRRMLRSLGMVEGLLGDWKSSLEAYESALALDSENPDLLRAAAEAAYQARRYPEAVRLMRRTVALRQDTGDRIYLANLLLAQEDYKAAEEQFRLCLDEAQDAQQQVVAYRDLVKIARIRKDNAEATRLLRELLRVGGTAEDRQSLIDLLGEQKDYPDLIHELKAGLGDPGDSDANRYREYIELGNVYYGQKELDRALIAFGQAVKLRKTASGLDSLAQVLQDLGKLPEAIEAREQINEIHPEVLNFIKLASLYDRSGRPNEALGALSSALQAGPSSDQLQDIYSRQAYLYAAQHNHREALQAFGRALALNDNRADLHVGIAETLMEMRDYPKALSHLECARALQSSDRILRMLALVYSETGRLGESAELYEDLLTRVKRPSAEAEEMEKSLGYVETRRGNFDSAGDHFLNAYAAGSNRESGLLYQTAQSYFHAENWSKAAETYKSLLSHADATPSTEKAWESLAVCQEKLGRYEAAADSLGHALSAGGNISELQQRLGFVYYQLSEWKDSLSHFLGALDAKTSLRALLGAARCYQHLNKPGLAIYYFQQAVNLHGELQPEELQTILTDLGDLYTGVAEYGAAADIWERRLRRSEDPAVRLELVRSLRLSNQFEAADQALQQINPDKLPGKLRSEYFDERFALLIHGGNRRAAAGALRLANQFVPAAWRDYQLGLFAMSQDRIQQAVAYFKAALEKDSASETYAEALANAFEKAGDHSHARQLFTLLIERDPENPQWRKALAYVDVQLSRNREAAESFRRALDRTPSLGNDEKAQQETYSLRSEITELNRTYDVTLYHLYEGNSYGSPEFGMLGSQVFPASSGLEIAYRPPAIGFRNGRIVEIFGRLLWSTESNFSLFQANRYQGSVGVRYKPLTRANVWVSAERLFHTADFVAPGWLLRGLSSWSSGAGLKPGRRAWDYKYALSDTAYIPGSGHYFAQYEELRQGLTVKLTNNFLFSPHLVADSRWQSHTAVPGSYLEAGGGASFRYLFNQTRYEAPRSSFEVLVQFKRGTLFQQGGALSKNVPYESCSLAGIFRL